jgi:hypothetical protein
MSSMAFGQQTAHYDALDGLLDTIAAADRSGLSTAERMALAERHQGVVRRLPALAHEWIDDIACYGTVEELGDKPAHVLANRLRIYPSEAKRLIEEAADLAPRRAVTGEPLPPRLEHVAAGQAAGLIGAAHVRVIRDFLGKLPCWVDEASRGQAEHDLADAATRHRPDELKGLAEHLDLCLNPDGNFSDEHRAARRGIHLGRQGPDGMSRFWGYLTPEARAGWEAASAKLAAPGMCNPADQEPTVTGTPSQDAIDADHRTRAQRQHDALNAVIRNSLMSGQFGEHNGLPVTIVATVELADLHNKTGVARTGGASWLPMSDLIRMSADAYHFLLLFDNAKPCALYKGRTTRCATPAQRLVLHATDRGCSHPGCTVPGYGCQVHHAEKDWIAGGQTNIDELAFACGPHNRLVKDGGWRTRKHKDGTTEWIPPPHLDQGQPRTNTYWHPQRMLQKETDDEDESR